jgi:hypothetical protein
MAETANGKDELVQPNRPSDQIRSSLFLKAQHAKPHNRIPLLKQSESTKNFSQLKQQYNKLAESFEGINYEPTEKKITWDRVSQIFIFDDQNVRASKIIGAIRQQKQKAE